MAFNLRDFILKTIVGMVGSEPDYKVRETALGWFTKSVLTEDDLAEIDAAIEAKNVVPEPEPEPPIEPEPEYTEPEPEDPEETEPDEPDVTTPVEPDPEEVD